MRRILSFLPAATRIVLGLIFFLNGLSGFFNFLPEPDLPEPAAAFIGPLAASGYFFPMLKVLETAAGLALIINLFVPLALVVLAPIIANIFVFHLVLAPAGLPLAIFLVVAALYLAWVYRDVFRSLLAPRHRARPFRRRPARRQPPAVSDG